MTHLVIPIKDIEAKIKQAETALENYKIFYSNLAADWDRDPIYQQALGKLGTYKSLLETSKKVSLEFNDITKQFDKWVKDNYSTGVGTNVGTAYRAALESLK